MCAARHIRRAGVDDADYSAASDAAYADDQVRRMCLGSIRRVGARRRFRVEQRVQVGEQRVEVGKL